MGCEKPQPITQATPSPTATVIDPGSAAISQNDASEDGTPFPTPTPSASVAQGLKFKDPQANALFAQYLSSYSALKALPVPDTRDVASNPGNLTLYTQQLAGIVNRLGEQQKALTRTLSPEEKRRFNAYVRSLSQSPEGD